MLTSSFRYTGPGRNWELSTRGILAQVSRLQKSQGYFEKIVFPDGSTRPYFNQRDLGIVYGELNTGRLPYYHRLDFYISVNLN